MNTMLPSAPKSFGRLTEVLASAFAAIGGDRLNTLGFSSAQKAVVILVDGLGVQNLKFQPGHAPFFNSLIEKSSTIECAFPSTTAASITSFATGTPAGKHAIIGYQVFDRSLDEPVNLLTGWSNKFPPVRQHQLTISQQALDEGIEFTFCGPAEYEKSGFTQATMPNGNYLVANTLSERFDAVANLLRQPGRRLVYLYIPELDQTAHAHGSESMQWLNKVEELDSLVKSFSAKLPANTGCVLTADHGIVDVRTDQHRFLDEIELKNLRHVGGDPRVSFLYFEESTTEEQLAGNLANLRESLGDCAHVETRDTVISLGWYGEQVSSEAMALMPDIFVIANSKAAFYHRGFAKAKSLKMIGQHGSISAEEVKIPLFRFGAFTK